MSLAPFEIEITSQGWITDTAESARSDLCSHGEIRLVIGGQLIVPGDESFDYTISTSALSLLRTLESSHSPAAPVADQLVMHCGGLLMSSCPIGVDWSVTHVDRRVRLHDVVRVDDVTDRGGTRFLGLEAELAEEEYGRRVVAFAAKAQELFAGVEKEFGEDDYERDLYPPFWEEYDRLLERHSRS